MSKSGSYDFEIQQGATFIETWKRSGVTSASGYDARIDVRQSQSKSSTLILQLTVGNGYITLSGDGSYLIMSLVVPAGVTAALPPGNFWYDLELVNGGLVERLLEGRVTVSPEVTLA